MWNEVIYRATDPDDQIFSVETTGISICDGTYCIQREQSGMYVFEYVYRGKGTVHVNGVTCYPKAGDVYILPRGSDHKYYSDSADGWRKLWFTANGSLIAQLLSAYGLEEVYHIPDCDQKELFLRLFRDIKDKKPELRSGSALLFHRLCINLAEKRSPVPHSGSPAAMKIKQYLDANLRKEVRLRDISKHVYKSPSQLIRIFKREFSMTPYEYVTRERIKTAKTLLTNHSYLSVKEIAYSLHFSDEHYFSSFFKSKVGMSPSQYQNFVQKSKSV